MLSSTYIKNFTFYHPFYIFSHRKLTERTVKRVKYLISKYYNLLYISYLLYILLILYFTKHIFIFTLDSSFSLLND